MINVPNKAVKPSSPLKSWEATALSMAVHKLVNGWLADYEKAST